MKLPLSIFTFSLMLADVLAMESILDQQPQNKETKALFKKLRTEPKNLTMQDFREIYKVMELSISSRPKHD